jgi:RHS repeat-associated protein
VTTPDGTENYTYDALGRLNQVSYPGGPTISYTYDAAGNRKTETRGGSTTNYDYDSAGQLVTDGNKTYTYDANGNLTQAGSDSFAWDYDNRLTQATVGTHTASYTYDGDGVRVGATIDGSPKTYLVDGQGQLPTLVDDGSKAYLHADGVLSEVGSTAATQLLGDALGSLRGLADDTGTLVGTRSYESFGTPRTSSGASSLFGFTGEPTDETGLVYLRARSLDPPTGRFISADSVIPNASGTQGYNLYSYSANNPTTWTDPTGHFVGSSVYSNPAVLAAELTSATAVLSTCLASLGCIALAIVIVVIFLTVACYLTEGCGQLLEAIGIVGSTSPVGAFVQSLDELLDAAETHANSGGRGARASPVPALLSPVAIDGQYRARRRPDDLPRLWWQGGGPRTILDSS